jgi:ferritin
MLNAKMEKALNAQLNAEFYSAYLYLSMAAYFESENLAGLANWMRIQFQEEQFHGTRFFDFILERGGKVALAAIDEPEKDWDGPVAVFAATLAHEQKVTGLINDLIYLARDERDNASEIFLQWFVKEQVEEESTADTILGKLKLAEGSPHALLMIDQELGGRVFTPPTIA